MSIARVLPFEATADVVIVGTGVAGLTAALDAAAAGMHAVVVTKADPDDTNTSWAQGGIAVVRDERDEGDSIDAHVSDTLAAAGGLADPLAVRTILEAGPGAIARLRARGAKFDALSTGALLRTREGGHHADRVIHAGGDATGAEVERALLTAPGLPVLLAGHLLLDVWLDALGRVAGVTVLDAATGRRGQIRCSAVILATGGSGQLYRSTTNPDVATGDGLAVAARAGAVLADLEFVQFHPTVLYTSATTTGHRPLVTEAVRGGGAVLIDGSGSRLMDGLHPMADLAPRDVVSLAITRTMAASGSDHVFLDATGIPRDVFQQRFPTVTAACEAASVRPWVDPIPVAPAAHYQCGGVLTDLFGRTTVPGLYAAGEVARTGLHGANRLASNSLLEGLVMGERVAQALEADLVSAHLHQASRRGRRQVAPDSLMTWPVEQYRLGSRESREAVQTAMSRHASIGRDTDGLAAALDRITEVESSPAGSVHSHAQPPAPFGREAVETANLALVAQAVLTAARARTESRGCHVRTDFAATDPQQARSTGLVLRDGRFEVRDLTRVRTDWREDRATAFAAAAV
jgi:L-aspartate oxidase